MTKTYCDHCATEIDHTPKHKYWRVSVEGPLYLGMGLGNKHHRTLVLCESCAESVRTLLEGRLD